MSAIIPTNRGGTCGICMEEFKATDRQLTHVGGESHNGFHRICFSRWAAQNPICPYENQAIDPNTFPAISRTERIRERLQPALVHAACASSVGIAASTAGMAIMEGAAILGLSERNVLKTAIAAARTALATGIVIKADLPELNTLGIVAILGVVEKPLADAMFGALGKLSEHEPKLQTELLFTLLTGAGAAVALGTRKILNRRIAWIDSDPVGIGVALGSVAAMTAIVLSKIRPLTTIAAIGLTGGVATGIASLF